MVLNGTRSVESGSGWYLVMLGHYWAVAGSGWCMMVLGQYGAVLVGTWWYWVSITWYYLELSGTGLIWGFKACIYLKKKVDIWGEKSIFVW